MLRRRHERDARCDSNHGVSYVLIVEDQVDLAQLLEFNLRQAGFNPRIAGTENPLTSARLSFGMETSAINRATLNTLFIGHDSA